MQSHDEIELNIIRLQNLMISDNTVPCFSKPEVSEESDEQEWTEVRRDKHSSSKRVSGTRPRSSKVSWNQDSLLKPWKGSQSSTEVSPRNQLKIQNMSTVAATSKKSRRRRKKRNKSKNGFSARDNLSKYKTEPCIHWTKTGKCAFGSKCLYSHGENDTRARKRCGKFRTETCSDPARESCGSCTYVLRQQNRCNFAHPGDAMRFDLGRDYFDEEYEQIIKELFPGNEFPYGIYI